MVIKPLLLTLRRRMTRLTKLVLILLFYLKTFHTFQNSRQFKIEGSIKIKNLKIPRVYNFNLNQVSYVPQMIGNHNIFITFNDEPVQGNLF